MIHNTIVATLTIGMALNDMPIKFEAKKGMRKPIMKQALDMYLSFLGSMVVTPVMIQTCGASISSVTV